MMSLILLLIYIRNWYILYIYTIGNNIRAVGTATVTTVLTVALFVPKKVRGGFESRCHSLFYPPFISSGG